MKDTYRANATGRATWCAAIAIGAVLCGSAAATESGGSIYPNGVENFLMGAMPPPGFYPLVYATSYHATELRDDRGNDIAAAIGGFRADVAGIIPRFIWVTGQQLFGGQLAVHAIVPLLNVDVRVGANHQRNTGIGDLNLAAALGYHVSPNLHYVVALETNAPTGRYDRNDVANIGRNYWNIEPLVAVSYIQASGLNADIKLMYDFNFKNTDTDYKSGQEFHVDYSLGYGFKQNWVVGVGGYAYKQTTNDERNGVKLHGNKGQAFAIGPSIKYDNGKGMLVTAKWQKEMNVENRPEGQAFWIKALLPF